MAQSIPPLMALPSHMQTARISNSLAVTSNRRLAEAERQLIRNEWRARYSGTSPATVQLYSDCSFCGIGSEPDQSGNCRGCGARRS